MPPKKQSKINIEKIGAIIAILGVLYAVWFYYPTIYSVAQGTNERVPLKLINGQQSYIQLKNSGLISVIIIVNFSSDGSIRFKKDTGQIENSIEVPYSVEPKSLANFPFIPLVNDSLKNATLIVKYSSYIENLPGLKPRQPKDQLIGVYEKTTEIYGIGMQWELRQSKY